MPNPVRLDIPSSGWPGRRSRSTRAAARPAICSLAGRAARRIVLVGTYAACLVCGSEQIGRRRDAPCDPQISLGEHPGSKRRRSDCSLMPAFGARAIDHALEPVEGPVCRSANQSAVTLRASKQRSVHTSDYAQRITVSHICDQIFPCEACVDDAVQTRFRVRNQPRMRRRRSRHHARRDSGAPMRSVTNPIRRIILSRRRAIRVSLSNPTDRCPIVSRNCWSALQVTARSQTRPRGITHL